MEIEDSRDHFRPRPRHLHRLILDADTAMSPPVNDSRARNSYNNEANFDTNMVIILAALLCALICALGLNSIVRCALRCSRRFTNDTAARLAATGLKKSALRQIPVAVYGSDSGKKIRETDCPICLGDFINGEKIKVLPKCNHGFHVRCVDMWLVSHSSCPTCRQSLLDQQLSSESAVADGRNRVAGNSPAGPRQGEVSITVDEIS